VFLSSISYIIKDISYLSLLKVKYITINKKFILNLDLLVLKEVRTLFIKGLRFRS
jgi:hypothetical protein